MCRSDALGKCKRLVFPVVAARVAPVGERRVEHHRSGSRRIVEQQVRPLPAVERVRDAIGGGLETVCTPVRNTDQSAPKSVQDNGGLAGVSVQLGGDMQHSRTQGERRGATFELGPRANERVRDVVCGGGMCDVAGRGGQGCNSSG